MEKDIRSRKSNSPEYSEAIPELLVEGWCSNCSGIAKYHLGDDDGNCLICKCKEYVAHEDSDIYERLSGYLKPEMWEESEDSENEGAVVIAHPEWAEVVVTLYPEDLEVFTDQFHLGQVSRDCKGCGLLKLYNQFGNSKDPDILCNQCQYKDAEEFILADIEDGLDELDELEESVIENERAYEDAIERQEIIDRVLYDLTE